MERKISLCITTYNRPQLTLKSFSEVINDDRISEIIIVDDCSSIEDANGLYDNLPPIDKLKLYFNDHNLGMSRNKAKAISLATNERCIILDSDNIISSSYIDRLFEIEQWNDEIIYCPCAALPNFDYSKYANQTFGKWTAKYFINERPFTQLLNTCNYFVNKTKYGEVYQFNEQIKASDTVYFNYLWLKQGGKFSVVKDMTYEHLVHQDSGWRQDLQYNRQLANHYIELIKQL